MQDEGLWCEAVRQGDMFWSAPGYVWSDQLSSW